jgi:NAD(P)-dependent dehydrogenase (short-subunit alcohol dehydrogenase family)
MDELKGKVALVAGGSRAAGRAIAVELGRRGATVYVTGRTTSTRRSEMNRPETIEETAALVTEAGGEGIAVRVDHLEQDEVRELVERVDATHGRLDVLVNDIWGGDPYLTFGKKLWEHSLDGGLRMFRLGIDTHAITSHFALPLLIRRPGGLVIEMTDGTTEYNANYRADVGYFYDLVKVSVQRMALAQAAELKPFGGTAVALTPGWLRSEAMLEAFGVTESTWHDATVKQPHFVISESPTFVGRAAAALAADPEVSRWSGQSLSSGQLAKVYDFTDADGSQPDAWRYIEEVQSKDKPANATGYR